MRARWVGWLALVIDVLSVGVALTFAVTDVLEAKMIWAAIQLVVAALGVIAITKVRRAMRAGDWS